MVNVEKKTILLNAHNMICLRFATPYECAALYQTACREIITEVCLMMIEMLLTIFC